jgi:hypothetical protein
MMIERKSRRPTDEQPIPRELKDSLVEQNSYRFCDTEPIHRA